MLSPSGYFNTCLYDLCELGLDDKALCNSLQAYADACRALGVKLPAWRNATFCRKSEAGKHPISLGWPAAVARSTLCPPDPHRGPFPAEGITSGHGGNGVMMPVSKTCGEACLP